MKLFTPGCQARVINPYQSQYPDPILIRKGETLNAGRKDLKWPGWVWCTSPSGKSGWVPESYLKIEQGQCLSLKDYDASELTVELDDRLILIQFESGWYWAQRQQVQGWIPAECVELVEDI